ncbi:MAG: 2OG-Fe(II) oxygenase [Rickettsiaceae bacterium]|nr:2OG-Fe(II) oxygenase [Rickettsiaceae bacterium]
MGAAESFISILEQINDVNVSSGSYYAEDSISPNELELRISVDGCGNIALPLSSDTIQKMLAATEPAKFGLRDQTLYDKDVRDTNEISAEKINISYNVNKFSSILDNIRNKLGLSEDIYLTPHLHNILIYSKGQFFAQHQDTEKLNGMLATLVMVLPSPHIGGALKIQHYGEEVECKSENINSANIKFIAFYSDCQHELEKVLDGYRVVVTFNLVAESRAGIAEKEIDAITMHKAALKEVMLNTLKEYEAYSYAPIPFITYLLNHQYTKHGLSWSLLRGADQLRAELIKRAAKDADCEVLLALIEAREIWSADGGYDYGDSNEDAEPQDLIDTEINVVHVIDINSKVVQYDQYIREKAVCYHLPNEEFKPFETEYEGYMGNYGNTVDYWYHRAAIIIYKKSDSFALSFLNDPNTVIQALLNESSAAAIKLQLEKLWLHWSKHQHKLIDLRLLLELAILVNDHSVAETILQHCSSASMLNGANDLICKLFSHYG